jgi:hypothetical protein
MSRLSRIWLVLARCFWAMVVGLGFVILIAALPIGLRQMRLDPPAEILAIVGLGLPLDFTITYLTIFSGIVSLINWIVGGLMVWRRSNDWFVLMISGFLIIWGVEMGIAVQIGMPVLVAAHPAWFWLGALQLAIVDLFFFLFGYLFPNGRFVPRWMGAVALLVLVLILPGNFFPGTILDIGSWSGLFFQLLPIPVFGSMVLAQIYRYKRVSNQVERQQTKWFVYGFAALIVVQSIHFSLLPILLLNQEMPGEIRGLILLLDFSVATLSLLLVPISIGIGILRYRLWDIDMLIRRTLIHATLTAILAAIYFANVIVFQRILPARSQASIVFTTLLVAALFSPLRRRVQNKIDRRFYRKKYDAGQISAAFASTLRHEVDLDTLAAALTQAIEETVEPEHISLWIREMNHKPPAKI